MQHIHTPMVVVYQGRESVLRCGCGHLWIVEVRGKRDHDHIAEAAAQRLVQVTQPLASTVATWRLPTGMYLVA